MSGYTLFPVLLPLNPHKNKLYFPSPTIMPLTPKRTPCWLLNRKSWDRAKTISSFFYVDFHRITLRTKKEGRCEEPWSPMSGRDIEHKKERGSTFPFSVNGPAQIFWLPSLSTVFLRSLTNCDISFLFILLMRHTLATFCPETCP